MPGGSSPSFWSPVKRRPTRSPPVEPATDQIDLEEPSAADTVSPLDERSLNGRLPSPLMARLLSGSKAVADALPSGFSASWSGSISNLRRRQTEPRPPPVRVPLRMLLPGEGVELEIKATAATTLAELQEQCSVLSGVPPELQLLRVEEEEAAAGDVLGGLLRSTAAARRRRLQRSVLDWVAFYLVPEGTMRELRGRGFVAGARSLWRALTDEDPELAPGSVQVAVLVPEGGGRSLLLRPPGEMTVQQLRLLVQQRADIVPGHQVLSIEQRQQPRLAAQLAWSLARLAVALLLSSLALLGRVLGLMDPVDGKVRIVLTTESGRQIAVSVAQDMSLRQLAERIEERHPGERLVLTKQALRLSPSRQLAESCGEWGEQQHALRPAGRQYGSSPAISKSC